MLPLDGSKAYVSKGLAERTEFKCVCLCVCTYKEQICPQGHEDEEQYLSQSCFTKS